jgi:hypothetical protein
MKKDKLVDIFRLASEEVKSWPKWMRSPEMRNLPRVNEMDEEVRKRWDKFLNGHWQREMPQKRGRFRLASVDGSFVPEFGIIYFDPTEKKYCSVSNWGGWWWSEPMPDLPKPPKW